MAQATLDQTAAVLAQLAEESQDLSKTNQERLEARRRYLLSQGMAELEAARETLVLALLIRDGLVSTIPVPTPEDEEYERFSPIVVQGEPVSETIIKERR